MVRLSAAGRDDLITWQQAFCAAVKFNGYHDDCDR